MKKRGIFSLVLLLILSMATVSAADYANLGTAGELVVTGQALYESEQNTASTVSIITADDIEKLQPASTAELIGEALGTGFSSYGALGAQQNVKIRGSNSNQVQIYLDGVLMNTAHEGEFNLATIPVSMIDHIEVVRSGTGSMGKVNAVGGMVNIVTKKGMPTDKPFTVSFENGSFLPLSYEDNGKTKNNWIGLVDSQKADISYTNAFGKLALTANAGGQVAQNNYTYIWNDQSLLRNNAAMWGVHGGVNASYDMNTAGVISLSNMTSYQHVGVPGGYQYGLTPENYQNDIVSTSKASYEIEELLNGLLNINVLANYNLSKTLYENKLDYPTTSDHMKQNVTASSTQDWNISDMMHLSSLLSFSWDGINSTAVGIKNRYTFAGSLAGSIYFFDGVVAIHPMARLDYTNDFKLAPSASLGFEYAPFEGFSVTANGDYAYRAPSFSDLYWPEQRYPSGENEWGTYPGSLMIGNPNIKPEKALSGDIGLGYTNTWLTYSGTAFVKDVRDLITWGYEQISQPVDKYGFDYYGKSMPTNLNHVFFVGTEQSLSVSPFEGLSLNAGYVLNYTWDLSSGNTFATNKRADNIRMHTFNFGVTYRYDFIEATVKGNYLGSYMYSGGESDPIFTMDLVINGYIGKNYTVYVAVDNLLNTQYQLSYGYPMPGTKIRIGGSAKF